MTTAPSERFRSYMGPGDKNLPMSNEIQGYQPVSRIGEVVMNAFGALRLPAAVLLSLHADVPSSLSQWMRCVAPARRRPSLPVC